MKLKFPKYLNRTSVGPSLYWVIVALVLVSAVAGYRLEIASIGLVFEPAKVAEIVSPE